jgi:NAD(P)H-dependent FMN reductase
MKKKIMKTDKKILIVATSKKNNYRLAVQIGLLLTQDHKLISLEDYTLPLYTANEKNVDKKIVQKLIYEFNQAKGIILCVPEYNYNIPPILSNAITWISTESENFREAFDEKIILLATHSGGAASSLLTILRNQLSHLGAYVHPRSIKVHRNSQFDPEKAKIILNSFLNILK